MDSKMEPVKTTDDSERMVNSTEDTYEDDPVDTRCGIGGCKPRWLQKFATVQGFVGFGALSNLVTFSLRMYLISQVTTLEKRFGFSSSQTGFILSSSQVSFVICILFFSHYGRHSNIPKILSVTASIVGLTGLLFSSAQFLPMEKQSVMAVQNQSLQSKAANVSSGTCEFATKFDSGVNMKSTCDAQADESSYTSTVAMAIFLIAMLIQGAVTAPRAPLGGTYLDDNNPVPVNSGKYVGIMMGILTLAPVLSFGMGAISSGIFHTLEPTELGPRDPRWIGAWWLGFIVLGILSIITASFVYCFPQKLKTHIVKKKEERLGEERKKEGAKSEKPQGWVESVKNNLKGPFFGAFRLLKKPVFLAVALGGTFNTCAFLGSASFATKYIETQFYIPAYKTNLMLGGISLLGSTLGPVCGGFVTSRFKLTTSGNLRVLLVVSVILTALCPVAMFINGKQTTLVRNDLPGMSGQSIASNSSCVGNCLCLNDEFRPVCGSDGLTYYSPCHAGCFSRANRTYSDCACANGTATAGFCAPEDSKVYVLLMYFTLTSFVITFTASPTFMIFVRSVSENDKALALGLSAFMSTLLGHFPGPILYGYIVDTNCILWQGSCSGRGACALYNLAGLRFKIFGTNMVMFVFSGICAFLALMHHQKKLRENPQKAEYKAVNLAPDAEQQL